MYFHSLKFLRQHLRVYVNIGIIFNVVRFFYVPFCKTGSDVVIEIITINNDTKYVTSDHHKCKYLNRFNIFIKGNFLRKEARFFVFCFYHKCQVWALTYGHTLHIFIDVGGKLTPIRRIKCLFFAKIFILRRLNMRSRCP